MRDDHLLLKTHCLEANRILLSGPSSPDGDSVGACLALCALLEQLGCTQVDVAGDLSFRYSWLPNAARCIGNHEISTQYEMVIILDGDRHRLTQSVHDAFHHATTTAIIDHHRSTSTDGYTVALLDSKASSTCSMIFELAEAWGCQIDAQIATNLYAGLVFDTGAFRHQNTTPETLDMAKALMSHGIDHSLISAKILSERRPEGVQLLSHVLQNIQFMNDRSISIGIIRQTHFHQLGCIEEDIEGIVEQLLYITGVEVAALCIEKNSHALKVSLRSRSEINVAALAQSISTRGGGHIRAAGATVQQPFDSGLPMVKAKILAAFSR